MTVTIAVITIIKNAYFCCSTISVPAAFEIAFTH